MFYNSKIKRLASAFLVVALLLCSVSTLAANTLSNTSVTAQTAFGEKTLTADAQNPVELTKSDLITVNSAISTPGADVTILMAKYVDGASDILDEHIKYMNQSVAGKNGECSVTFQIPFDIDGGTYAIYVGGEDVDTTDVRYFSIASSSPGTTYISGDVDKNGTVNMQDALWILRRVVAAPLPSGVTLNEDAGDVDGNNRIDATDATYILRHTVKLTNPQNVTVGQQITM